MKTVKFFLLVLAVFLLPVSAHATGNNAAAVINPETTLREAMATEMCH